MSTSDLWFQVATDLDKLSTEHLLKRGLQLKQACDAEDAVQRRLHTTHPGWAGTCGRPMAGLIRIILLLRGAGVTFKTSANQ